MKEDLGGKKKRANNGASLQDYRHALKALTYFIPADEVKLNLTITFPFTTAQRSNHNLHTRIAITSNEQVYRQKKIPFHIFLSK